MIKESEDLKKLKAMEHPCGHCELALKEIKLRDDYIAELEAKLKYLDEIV